MMKWILLMCFALLAAVQALPAATPTDRSPNHTVAVYWWPNFHRDAFHQSKKWPGWTEWEIVKSAKPLFEGHQQPKVPLWGYRDEADPDEAARSIDAMADVGIDVLIFDWYRYDEKLNKGEMIERALREGVLQAPNRQRIKFALMWANHTYIDCHPFAPGKHFGNAEVWHPGEVSEAAFVRHTSDAIASYFQQPNYWLIEGKPYFSIYEIKTLVKGLGSAKATRAVFDDFRKRTQAAGFPGLHLALVDWSIAQALAMVKGEVMPGDPSRKIETEKDLVEALGIDSATWYTWVHHIVPVAGAASTAPSIQEQGQLTSAVLMGNAAKAGLKTRDYMDWGTAAMNRQSNRSAELGIPLMPHVARGWDGSPRNYQSGIVVGNTPEAFRHFLAEAKAMADRSPKYKGIITINSWNEWVEGSYLEPDVIHGTAYLDAIYNVFGGQASKHPD